MPSIMVIGSLNIDLVIRAERAPAGGETLPAQEFHIIPGGKGANQAIAIARLGGSARLVGRVGMDDYGDLSLSMLRREGVDVSCVRRDAGDQTGLAFIIVDGVGENRILLFSGANAHLDEEDIDSALRLEHQPDLIVCQFEVMRSATYHAIESAFERKIPLLLNPAPAYAIPEDVLQKISYLVLNETEAPVVSGIPVRDVSSAGQAASFLVGRGAGVVVVTLGSQGAVVASAEGVWSVPSFSVRVVDTTAAGDAFIGGFATASVRGLPLVDRIRFANACGALAATKLGAQTSLPHLEEVKQLCEASQLGDIDLRLVKGGEPPGEYSAT